LQCRIASDSVAWRMTVRDVSEREKQAVENDFASVKLV
jgi:hypothetical protein